MSQFNIVQVSKVIEEKEPYEGEYEGKAYTSYEFVVSGAVDNVPSAKIVLKTTKEAIREQIQPGACFECEFKNNKGFKSYKIKGAVDPSLVGASPGASASSPTKAAASGGSTNRSIERQVALKTAAELYKGDPAFGLTEVLSAADAFDSWLRGEKPDLGHGG